MTVPTQLAFALICLVAGSASGVVVFNDGFDDGAFDDASPVTWTPTAPAVLDASSGDLRIATAPDSPAVIGADVPEVLLTDTSVRSQLRAGQNGSFVAVTARNQQGGAGGYFGGVFTGDGGSSAFMGLNDGMGGTPFFGGQIPLELDATQTDVIVQLDVFGTSLSLRVWAPGEPIPQEPVITANDSMWLSGTPGVAMTADANAAYDFRRVVVGDEVLGELPGPIRAQVNTLTGAVHLQVDPELEAEIVSYELTSPSGSLNPVGWDAGNLSARGVDASGDTIGESWSPILDSETTLIEGFLLGASTFEGSREEAIGLAYDVDQDSRDLTFSIATAGGEVLPGVVEYVAEPTVAGDYDLDRDVDADDYTLWAASFGRVGVLGADGNGDRVVNAADYTAWRDAVSAAAGVAPVPEGSAAGLALATLVGAAVPPLRRAVA